MLLKPTSPLSTPPFHTLRAIIPAKNIVDMKWTPASEDTVPECVKAALTEDMKLDLEELAFLNVVVSHVQMPELQVPATYIPAAGDLMRGFISNINETNKSNEHHNLTFIICNMDVEEKLTVSKMIKAWLRECRGDPLESWVRDSPNKLLLGVGNIQPPASRHPLSTEGLVLFPKRAYQDNLDLKVHTVYAITGENDFERACNAE